LRVKDIKAGIYCRQSFVYFMRAPGWGIVKIGRSNSPFKRLRTVRHKSPHPVELVTMITEGPNITERRFHRALKHLRVNGEWFLADDDLLDLMLLIRDTEDPIERTRRVKQRLIELESAA
jgi:hypothetical protein